MYILITAIIVGTFHGPHYFDYCSSVISFDVMRCESSFVLFQDCLDCLGSLAFPYEFQSLFSLFLQKKKDTQNFNRDYLESVGQFRQCSYYKFFWLFFHWNRFDLQCCVSFRCTAAWFSYTYIHSISDSQCSVITYMSKESDFF